MRDDRETAENAASSPIKGPDGNPFGLFDVFPDKVFMIDPDGNILECNAAFARRFSRTPDACRGLNIFSLITGEIGLPEIADNRRRRVDEVCRTAQRLIFDEEYEGNVFRSTIYPVPSDDGTIGKLLLISQDITENRRAEKEAEHGWLFIQAIIDATPGTFCLLDTKGRILALNPYLCEKFIGKTSAEMTGVNSMELVHPDDRRMLGKSMQKVIMHGTEESAEVRILVKGGPDFLWFLLKSRRIVIEQNHMLIVIGTDIHDRKEIEQALAISEQKFRSIAEQLEGEVFILDSDGVVTYISPASESISGFPPDEMTGRSFTEFIHEENRQSAVENFLEMLTDDDKSTKRVSVVRCLRKNGTFFWGEVHVKLYLGHGINGMIGLLFDITTRKRQETLKAFRLRILQLSESYSMDDMLRVIVDEAEKQTESRIGFFHCFGDDSSSESLQVASTSVEKNMKWANDDNPHPKVIGAGFWADALREGRTVINNSFNQPPDPKNEWSVNHPQVYRTLIVPIVQKEKIVALIGVANKAADYDEDDEKWIISLGEIAWDIVARKFAEQSRNEMQALLIQSQKMELIGQLAGGIAHDFNNMLGVILGNIEMAMTLQPVHGMLQRNLMNILSAVNRSSDLTTQLLAFAKEQAVMPIVVELNTMVENLLVMLRRIIGENITMVWIPDSHRSLIKVDPAQIDQILVNLCINARNAITGTGTITIQTGCWQCVKQTEAPFQSSKIPGDYITLSVSDTGCGIDNENLPHIFEPFFTVNKQGKGVGLGLATVYGIVRQNNGYIDCQSEPGSGTTFTIHFPRFSGTYFEPDLQEEQPAEEVVAKETVLLVEDEPDILNLCRLELEKNGYKVLSASGPFEAISIAESYAEKIDLLLTDVVMPKMNGCDLAKKLLLDIPRLKTLFMSGYTPDVIDYPDMFDRKINYIQKPFTLKALVTAVRKLLNHPA
ncbi:MAG: PAS domain S-box protein [Chlorobiaceae bacterium]|nr:PAS domain S-box protein [Chlorobiaceae bacterium]